MNYQLKYLKFLSTFLLSFSLFFTGFYPDYRASAGEIKTENKQTKSNKVGKFILQYQPSSSNYYEFGEISAKFSNQEIRQKLIETQVFDQIITELNTSGLIMREDIPVVFQECGNANAYWSPSERQITVCYENTALDLILFNNLVKYPSEQAWRKSINETVVAFYHELGHALIDVLSLSAVGQEEDTVDEFAVVMLFRKYNPSIAAEMVLDSSEYYELLYKIGGRGPGWDEHAPNDKRLFNLVCLVYGSNPEEYEKIFIEKFVLVDPNQTVNQDKLNSRAAKCKREFPQKMDSWNKLLLPHYASQNGDQKTPVQSSPGNSPGVSRRGRYW
ncbi:DUF4344 domain-containing metallopeptidase [Crocosphaera sp. XPORK-15E]|uniref:DUF4344 domain-containing metallopeptidase n=1 Tax=Crocosphaera sp. XPORK-15E TaxID=3110247 RepID=UPI002B20F751|nr:DUF4344 domain-containing metallopeptidase [Crocosphaera sp. XPORK-15E]MEA5533350.1 DUF4344 domain-containing metallopeptidase [Crocosphaera sp. XPORK-15E]